MLVREAQFRSDRAPKVVARRVANLETLSAIEQGCHALSRVGAKTSWVLIGTGVLLTIAGLAVVIASIGSPEQYLLLFALPLIFFGPALMGVGIALKKRESAGLRLFGWTLFVSSVAVLAWFFF